MKEKEAPQLSKRQADILNIVCREYIKHGRPVSSQAIAKSYGLGISPATVRAEMLELDRLGFVIQPHTSAGRTPSDRAYRFFVDSILKDKEVSSFENKLDEELESLIAERIKTSYELPHYLSKTLASFSRTLAFAGFLDDGFFYKHGFKELMANPEFEEKSLLEDFGEMLDGFDDILDSENEFVDMHSLTVYIGREVPLKHGERLSVIAAPITFKRKRGIVGVWGQKRMDYDRNIRLVKEMSKILEEF